ncbi:MAG: tRNA guanosine(34) transglycosylase Tgt [Chloroflexi bacterium]|nr:tRNA guanosine(34) transglycosylase Tgt [Chloroflexota bacterium]
MTVRLEILAHDGTARAGLLHTPHGTIATPAFFPVATQATVKALTIRDLEGVSAPGLLANAFHLWQRPGHVAVQGLGGLHRFMGWNRPIVTDSGGFQVFSLADLADIDEDGVQFRSHLDGSARHLTPELAIEIQQTLGSDVAMVLDICAAYPCPSGELRAAAEQTQRWAERSLRVARDEPTDLFGIIQGGVDLGLRSWCATELGQMPFGGFGIGGLSVGEPRSETWPALEAALGPLPADRTRYLMGVGAPDDLVEGIARGVDLFDCVLPTRLGRHGSVLTRAGKLNLRSRTLASAAGPLDPACDCLACTGFPLAFLHYLARLGDPLGMRLASLHNIRFLTRLVEEARGAILKGQFAEFRESQLADDRTHHPSDHQ